MALASVTREQFKIRSELEVVHIPTGAVFSAYPYSNPDEIGTTRAHVAMLLEISAQQPRYIRK